jgi:hypothetical protein
VLKEQFLKNKKTKMTYKINSRSGYKLMSYFLLFLLVFFFILSISGNIDINRLGSSINFGFNDSKSIHFKSLNNMTHHSAYGWRGKLEITRTY